MNKITAPLLYLLPFVMYSQNNGFEINTELQNPQNPYSAPTVQSLTPDSVYNDLIVTPLTQNNQQIMQEVEKNEAQLQKTREEVFREIAKMNNVFSYSLPSYSSLPATDYYYKAFEKLIQTDTSNYSISNTNFLIENAYYENTIDKENFDKIIKNSRDFILAKMKELNYNPNSNLAKNYMLFQFFSEHLKLKAEGTEHLPFKYDFEDYTGINDHSNMFVTNLLQTGTGQCHSMPLLYLILAEAINAEAYLALSPNHSYIRFPADNGKWYNIELTNGMFSTDSYILQSGYIKSEALQNNIYMQNLNNKELLGQQLTDLAQGYIHKFGYDEFVGKTIDKALELYPNSITANMIKASLDRVRFEYVAQQIGINPYDKEQLQQIRYFPEVVELLNTANAQFAKVGNLGYEPMPDDAYQKWLQAMNTEKEKQENETVKKQFKGVLENSKIKD